MDQARPGFRRLAADATATDLRRHSVGTKWTSQELLFRMLFGYLVVRALLGRAWDPPRTTGRCTAAGASGSS